MHFEDVRQWQGTAEAIAKELKRQIEQFGLSVEPPALRTVRSWRAKQLLSQPKGQEFGFRQILEGLATALLVTLLHQQARYGVGFSGIPENA